jgi:signal transduction histidine kinase/anti-sigma regulatory factor (Ser/Thr protein kinase)
METPIMALDINNEMDIMLAHRRGMQFAKFSGMSLSEQTRFATAVSEICRNCVEHAFKGHIKFSIIKTGEKHALTAVIKDGGKGIKDLEEVLKRTSSHYKGRGLGIVYAKRLADEFNISSTGKGTTVRIQKAIPAKSASIINNLVVQGWIKHLQNEPAISAYEELKMRNVHLVELTEELRANASMVEKQIEEIKKLNERLSENNAKMKAFTYAISHDLKTPLTNLKISSHYLINTPGGEDGEIFKGILSRSVSRMDKTIHSLIEILDVQNKDNHVVRELSFEELFADVRDEHEASIAEAQAVLVADFTSTPTIRYVDAYLQSVLRNLLSNSLKYRDPARPLTINVSTKTKRNEIQLIFADSAVGMDMNLIKDRLFAPFSRFSSQGQGRGIGLYLIKSMVENNGGSVVVESTPGVGTIFSFTLVPYQ